MWVGGRRRRGECVKEVVGCVACSFESEKGVHVGLREAWSGQAARPPEKEIDDGQQRALSGAIMSKASQPELKKVNRGLNNPRNISMY